MDGIVANLPSPAFAPVMFANVPSVDQNEIWPFSVECMGTAVVAAPNRMRVDVPSGSHSIDVAGAYKSDGIWMGAFLELV